MFKHVIYVKPGKIVLVSTIGLLCILTSFTEQIRKEKKMKTILHKANDRGKADHGWLKSFHSFSFAGFYDPEKVHFGKLRVLNDDSVAAGMGFGTHPHDNMEIVSIPLEGALEHRDNMGTQSVIRKNDVQIMSAGTGVTHSEYNHSKTDAVKFLQIWIMPKERNIQPRYDQKNFAPEERTNKLQVVVSPEKNDSAIWINQDAWFSLGKFDKTQEQTYTIKKENNGAYVFVLKGEVTINGTTLKNRDALGVYDTASFSFTTSDDAEMLVIDVPMQ